jgi:uncharacterized OB-fold protein
MSEARAAQVVGPEEQFFRFLREGRFMIQRNRATGHHVFYPRASTFDPSQESLEWVEASGLGKVYSCTVARRKPEQGGDISLALVDLAEGPRMLSRILGIDPSSVKIGMDVQAHIERPSWNPDGADPVIVFRPVV